MTSKVQFYSAMASYTATHLTDSWQRWTAFLTTASRLYKYPFHEQLMIFAQRPDATACAEYDLWNDTMRRYVRRGSKGIALVDNSREKPRLRYVFDISDTGLRKNSRHPFLWELRPEHEAAVAQALAERFGTPPENNLAEQLESIAAQLVSEYWVEHKRDIHIRPTFSLTGQPPWLSTLSAAVPSPASSQVKPAYCRCSRMRSRMRGSSSTIRILAMGLPSLHSL